MEIAAGIGAIVGFIAGMISVKSGRSTVELRTRIFGGVARLTNHRLKLSKTKRATYMALFATTGK